VGRSAGTPIATPPLGAAEVTGEEAGMEAREAEVPEVAGAEGDDIVMGDARWV
jgi:hypothetical protein